MNLTIDADRNIIGGRNTIGSDEENCSETLSFTIADSSLWGYSAYLEFMTEDGKTYTTDALAVSQTAGTFSYALPNGLMQAGCLTVQAVLRNSDGTYVYKSAQRLFVVKGSVNAGDAIALKYPDFIGSAEQALEDATKASEDATQAAADAKTAVDNAETAVSNADAAVAAANQASSAMKSLESSVESAEQVRAETESQRQSAETSRDTAESARVSSEDSRVSAEAGRVSAEQGRVGAEAGRVSAESTRASEWSSISEEASQFSTISQDGDTLVISIQG